MTPSSTPVAELRTALNAVPPDTKISFGSSRFLRRPLVFNQVKRSSHNTLLIELYELEQDEGEASELEQRITAKYLLDQIEPFKDNDLANFGADIEGNIFIYKGVTSTLSINLDQDSDPDNRSDWRVKEF